MLVRNTGPLLPCLSLSFLITLSAGAQFNAPLVNLSDLDEAFVYQYDYELKETAGLARNQEPVEISLTVPRRDDLGWFDNIRVVHILEDENGALVPHEVLGSVTAGGLDKETKNEPHPASSVNIAFFADCPASSSATYRIYWDAAESGTARDIPKVKAHDPLKIEGEAPGLTIENAYYSLTLHPDSGAIQSTLLKGQMEENRMYYHTIPIHFGTDVWSPNQGWDHDYDWASPPSQKLEGGPLVLRYHRWGPLHEYTDVIVSITYTFYAYQPYVHVSSTMEFTKDRSVRMVRMGEIVVHHGAHANSPDKDPTPEFFSHYAWPERDGSVTTRSINEGHDEQLRSRVEGLAPGAIAILDRDVNWVAGYHADKNYGMASLRLNQFAGNRRGGPVPQSAPSTYVANYGWAFSYWSRPMVSPMGTKGSALDQNMAVADGTIYGAEECLLVFAPGDSLAQVQEAYGRVAEPLRFMFKGTGPW
ncbi:MAG: hypothetical protein KJ052_06530 [Candidatus Hydrogenedentes bacterium]|nr:hypothetical protein [Candidatus Hydrogenedentota bacterium]